MALKIPTTIAIFLVSISIHLLVALSNPDFGVQGTVLHHIPDSNLQSFGKQGIWKWREKNARRVMIGSTAPTCTYNECRGCRFKCRAEQVPVDANDPANSAYHYRCVCHR